jgi:monofunctional biosynthetic peptidoglycan transglycosylase
MRKIKKILLYTFISVVVFVSCAFFFSLAWVGYYSKGTVGYTTQMNNYKFESLFVDSVPLKVEYQWVPIDSISRNLIIAVLAAQDKDFYVHEGFKMKEYDEFLNDTVFNQELSISQLAAQNTFSGNSGKLLNSLLTDYFTILEESLWNKDRILEMYLNTASLGHGIFGAEAASQIYFSKAAGYLTREEAAFIALLYVEPKNEVVDFYFPSSDICSKQFNILTKMSLMTQIKVGKNPVDETVIEPARPIYKRNWRG